MGDMKEIHDAAFAYYRNLSEDQRRDVYRLFRAMADGDGALTIKEFQALFGGPSKRINQLFQDVDENGDGRLEFKESVTLFYCVINERLIGCHGCNVSFLKGLYFTCVDCFHNNETTTFDLCTSCYGSRNYVHHHSSFLDNYTLLRTKAAYNNKSESSDQPSTPNYQAYPSTSQTAPSTPNYQAYPSTSQTAPRIPKHQVSRPGSQTAGALNAMNTGAHVVNTGIHVVKTGVHIMDLVNNGNDIGSTVADIGSTVADIASLCSIM